MMLDWVECVKIASLFFIKIIQKMGNDNKRSEFDQENWEILSTNGTKTILKNRLTHSLLDLYQCDQDSESLLSKRSRDLYEWRKNLPIHQHIPVLYHYQVETPLLGSVQHQKIFTQHLTRFIQMTPISKQESFLILEQIITVLPLLYKQFGLFHVNVYTVAFNDAGVTKVWINENVAKNSVEPEDIIKKPSQNLQLSIVNNLVRMVKTKVYNEEIKPDYPFSLNFLETLKFIKKARQKLIDYDVSQVYFNRNEFNQKYQVGANQRIQQVPNVAAFPIKPETIPLVAEVNMAVIKTAPYKQPTNLVNPLPYHIINNPPFYQNNYAPPTFERQNKQPIHFYPLPPNHFPYSPFDKNNRANIAHNVPNNPKNFPIQNAQKIHQWRKTHNQHTSMQPTHKQQPLLQQSYYISNPQIPLADSPTKQKKSFSPTKTFKGINNQARIPNIISPRRQENLITDLSDRTPHNQTRPISLSPNKKRPIKEEFKAPEAAIQKPVWIRPISSNNRTTPKKELSRIVEQEQSRFDSFYIKNLQKKSIPDSQDGFNVQMVESIYVKTNQTQEGV